MGTDFEAIRDLETGVELRRFEGMKAQSERERYWPTGRRALLGCGDSTMRLFDLENGTELRRFEARRSVTCVALLPDGRRACRDPKILTLRLWDLETGAELRRFEGMKAWSLAWPCRPTDDARCRDPG